MRGWDLISPIEIWKKREKNGFKKSSRWNFLTETYCNKQTEWDFNVLFYKLETYPRLLCHLSDVVLSWDVLVNVRNDFAKLRVPIRVRRTGVAGGRAVRRREVIFRWFFLPKIKYTLKFFGVFWRRRFLYIVVFSNII